MAWAEPLTGSVGAGGRHYGLAWIGLLVLLVSGCATTPPSNPDNVCSIFSQKRGWYTKASTASRRWSVPVPVMMAILHQESRFVADAKPPRRWYLGFIPGPRPSDAYGYPQALGSTWRDYQRTTRRYGASRDNFGDAVDFVGWYTHQSLRRAGIRSDDAYHLYLAYHEGHGGYLRRSYAQKKWLLFVAQKVAFRSRRYATQLSTCQQRLERQSDRWFF